MGGFARDHRPEHREPHEKNALPYSFLTYGRVAPARNRGEVESG